MYLVLAPLAGLAAVAVLVATVLGSLPGGAR